MRACLEEKCRLTPFGNWVTPTIAGLSASRCADPGLMIAYGMLEHSAKVVRGP
jgi:hypothetical protein